MRRLLIAVLICVLAPAAALAAGIPVSGTFKGRNSEGRAVSITIVNGTIAKSAFHWEAFCPLPYTHLTGKSSFQGQLYRHRYHVHNTYTAPVRGGGKSSHVVTAAFSVKRRTLKGSFSLVATVYSAKGAKLVVCSTPKITFKLKS